MSDTSLNNIIQYGTSADRIAFTPDPAIGSQVLYIWYDTDSVPDTYIWDGIAWVLINVPGGTGDVVGPASAVNNHVALFDTTSGKLIKDGGALPTGDVVGPGSAVSGNLAVFSGTSGKVIVDGGAPGSGGINELTGDVTAGPGTGSQAATIANDAVITAKILNANVTYGKIQDISATVRILGRKTAGAGSIEECTLSQILDFLGSAAQGDILFRGSAGWQYLAPGTSGNVLQTNGAGADPSWVPGGGGGGGATWTLVGTQAMSGLATFDFTGLSGYTDLRVTFENCGFNSSSRPGVLVSTDNGSTFLNTSGDYNQVFGDATLSPTTFLNAVLVNRFGGVYSEAYFEGFNGAFPCWVRTLPNLGVDGGALQYLPGTTARNAIRVMNSGLGVYNAGTVTVYGR